MQLVVRLPILYFPGHVMYIMLASLIQVEFMSQVILINVIGIPKISTETRTEQDIFVSFMRCITRPCLGSLLLIRCSRDFLDTL